MVTVRRGSLVTLSSHCTSRYRWIGLQRQMVKLSGGIAAEKGKALTIVCIQDEGSFEEVVLSKGVHNTER